MIAFQRLTISNAVVSGTVSNNDVDTVVALAEFYEIGS